MAIRMHLLHIIIVAGTFVTQTAGKDPCTVSKFPFHLNSLLHD
jgi:hypothetical protein